MAKTGKTTKRRLLVIHGLNLNLLGTREPKVYGSEKLVAIPFIEVHFSDVHAREPFRHRSYFSDLAVGTVCGLGSQGYDFARAYALRHRR